MVKHCLVPQTGAPAGRIVSLCLGLENCPANFFFPRTGAGLRFVPLGGKRKAFIEPFPHRKNFLTSDRKIAGVVKRKSSLEYQNFE